MTFDMKALRGKEVLARRGSLSTMIALCTHSATGFANRLIGHAGLERLYCARILSSRRSLRLS
jgi:hypothetical protein